MSTMTYDTPRWEILAMQPAVPNHAAPSILIVDDTPANVAVLAESLQEQGYRVLVAQDGQEALERVQYVLPDLILLDVMMPVMDGFETCRRLKALDSTKRIPVIFMTALSEADDKVNGFAAGGVDYITKPFQMSEVLARVHTHITLYLTTKKLMETHNALITAQRELASATRRAALTSMVVGIAHQFNTPIGNCLLVASTLDFETNAMTSAMAAESGIKRAELGGYLQRTSEISHLLQRNLERMTKLVENFKQIATNQKFSQISNFSLADLLALSVKRMQQEISVSATTVVQNVPENLRMASSFEALNVVIINLLGNAMTHGFAGRATGVITITGKTVDEDHLEITIHDNGVGISAAHLERIFVPFFTTKLADGSSGLGLTICENIVTEVLGGKISVYSQPDVGTSVVLTLPTHLAQPSVI